MRIRIRSRFRLLPFHLGDRSTIQIHLLPDFDDWPVLATANCMDALVSSIRIQLCSELSEDRFILLSIRMKDELPSSSTVPTLLG
jgi:hypothetical protein